MSSTRSTSGASGTSSETPADEDTETPAPPWLMYVPGLVPTENNSATRITQLIAQFASIARQGTYTIKVDPGTPGGFVLNPSDQAVLHVVEVDYHTRIYKAEPNGPATDKATLASAFVYAAWGLIKLIATMRKKQRKTRHALSRNAKWQLVAGFIAVLTLLGSLLMIAVTLVVTLFPGIVPESLTKDPAVRWVFGASMATLAVAVYWWLRPRLLNGGRLLRAVMRYVERDRQMIAVVDAFDAAYDAILDEDPQARIHVLAYSFGSIVALDALFPRNGDVERRPLEQLESLVTIGSPADFIRLYYPEHFDGRSSRCARQLPWMNIYIPADVLGSDFRDHPSTSPSATLSVADIDPIAKPNLEMNSPTNNTSADSAVRAAGHALVIAEMAPTIDVPEGRLHLNGHQILTLDGFQLHGSYWGSGEPRYLRSAVPKWIPPFNATIMPKW